MRRGFKAKLGRVRFAPFLAAGAFAVGMVMIVVLVLVFAVVAVAAAAVSVAAAGPAALLREPASEIEHHAAHGLLVARGGPGRTGGAGGRRRAWCFLGQRQQRIALRAAETPPRMLAQKENHKREDKTKTDGQCEWND